MVDDDDETGAKPLTWVKYNLKLSPHLGIQTPKLE